MQVQMKDVLPGGFFVRLEQGETVGLEGDIDRSSDPYSRAHDRGSIFLGDVKNAPGVSPWHHEHVAIGRRAEVHERDATMILVDDLRRGLTLDDCAERAVHVPSSHAENALHVSVDFRMLLYPFPRLSPLPSTVEHVRFTDDR